MPDQANNSLPSYLTTKEVADLLRVKERRLYELVSEGSIPHIKATGKLLFPQEELLKWLKHDSTQHALAPRPLVVAGSQDPLLDWAIRESQCGLATHFDGSTSGLNAFAKYQCQAACIHLMNKEEIGYNSEAVQTHCSGLPFVVVKWADRSQGLVYKTDKPQSHLNPENRDSPTITFQKQDLIKQSLLGKRLAIRQQGAGSRLLLDRMIQQAGLDASSLIISEQCRTETDAVTAVVTGMADVCVGPQSLASMYQLGYTPLVTEEVDLIVDRHAWFEPAWQKLMGFCDTPQFKEKARQMTGYNITKLGQVKLNSVN